MFCLPKMFLALGIAFACASISLPVLAQKTKVAGKSFVTADAVDWRQKLGAFRIGIIGGNRPILETRRIQPFRKALQKELGVPVEVFAATDYKTLIAAHISGRVEYAIYSSQAFSAAWLLCKCVEPLVAPTAEDGALGFRSVLLSARKKATSLSSLKGKSVLVPGRHSFTGYLLPRQQLSEEGINIESFGWALEDTGNFESAIVQLANGKSAGLFGWIPDYGKQKAPRQQLVGTLSMLGKRAKDFKAVWQSSFIPHGPHAVHRRLDGEAKNILGKFLSKLKQNNIDAYEAVEVDHAGGFRPISIGEYQPVIDLLRATMIAASAVPSPLDKVEAASKESKTKLSRIKKRPNP